MVAPVRETSVVNREGPGTASVREAAVPSSRRFGAYAPGDFSIADIANWSWVRTHAWSGVSVEGLEPLRGWMKRMSDRPACRRGVDLPFPLPTLTVDDKSAEEFAKGARTLLQRLRAQVFSR